jgi:hypothetical protein
MKPQTLCENGFLLETMNVDEMGSLYASMVLGGLSSS